MTVKELAEKSGYQMIHLAQNADTTEIKTPYCCDLLSVAMSKVPEGAAWVTVMSNLNTLAVAALTEAACVILSEGAAVEENMKAKAVEQDITVLWTEQPVFEAALFVHHALGKN